MIKWKGNFWSLPWTTKFNLRMFADAVFIWHIFAAGSKLDIFCSTFMIKCDQIYEFVGRETLVYIRFVQLVSIYEHKISFWSRRCMEIYRQFLACWKENPGNIEEEENSSVYVNLQCPRVITHLFCASEKYEIRLLHKRSHRWKCLSANWLCREFDLFGVEIWLFSAYSKK